MNENFATTDILSGNNRCLAASNGTNLGCHNFVAGQTTYIGLYPIYFPDANGFDTGTISQITTFNNSVTKSARVITSYFAPFGINAGRRSDLLAPRDPLSFNPPPNLDGSTLVVASEDNTAIITNNRSNGVNRKGATAGILRSQSSKFWYIPLVMSNAPSANGPVNSAVHIMNTENKTINITLFFRGDTSAYNGTNYTVNFSVAPYASYTYFASSVAPLGWYGSATVDGNENRIAVTSDLLQGSDTVQSFNAFPIERQSNSWVIPLFTSWLLSNHLTTVVGVQNLGSQINTNRLQLDCTVSPGTPGTNFTKVNTIPIPTNGAYYFNPVTDRTIPTNWYGSCRVTALDGQNIVSFVQMRVPPPGTGALNPSNAAAYEAMPANGGKTLLIFPYIRKRPAPPATGIATGVTIQNLTASMANVTYTYYNTNGTAFTTVNCTIAANSNRLHNHRIQPEDSCAPNLPDGWIGSLVVTSDRAIDGFNQITDTGNPSGDSFMAHYALP